MEKFVPYAKLSKKQKKAQDAVSRRTWETNPGTRRVPNGKAYRREKARQWRKDFSSPGFFVAC